MKHTRIEDLSQDEKNQLLERMLREGRFPGARPHAPFGGSGVRVRNIPPRTEIECQLAEMLGSAFLGKEPGVYQPLQASLIGTELLDAMAQRYSVKISRAELSVINTLAALAALIDLKRLEQIPHLPITHCEEQTPLSPHQLRYWFFHHLEGPASAFNLMACLTLEGSANIPLVVRACHDLYQCHEILRASFPAREGQPSYGFSEQTLDLALVDISVLPEPRLAVNMILQKSAAAPLNPTQGKLSRLLLLRVAPTTHMLVLTQHMMVADRYSLEEFFCQLGTRYQQYLQQPEPEPLTAPLQYRDFSHWQWQHAEGAWSGQGDYWRKQLAHIPERHQLHLDRPRPNIQRFMGGREKLRISQKLTSALKELGANEGADLFMTLQAAFATFLFRYSQSDDILIGTFLSPRVKNPELNAVLGPCSKALVLRTRTSCNPMFLDLLHQVRRCCLEAFANADLPFERVVDLLAPERDLSQTPLFQIAFQWQEPPVQPLFPGLSCQLELDNPRTCLYDLNLVLEFDQKRLTGYFEYNIDLFDAASVVNMVRHFKTMLAALPLMPETPIANLPLLSSDERETMLVDWNSTAINLGAYVCIHDLFHKQVAHTPDAPALLCTVGERQLSYAELNALANRLAHTLIGRGIGPENTVGLCCRRSLATVVGILAILKAGAAFLPLDPDFPNERLAYIMSDAAVPVLLVDNLLKEIFKGYDGTVILLNEKAQCEHGSLAEDNPIGSVRDVHRASLFYTSGSLGFPKGVITNHRALVNRLRWAQEVFPFNAKDRFLQLAPFHFDISLWEIMAPLISGAQLVLPPPDIQTDIGELVRLVVHHQISALHFIPSLLHAFLQDARIFNAKKLRLVFCGGDVLSMSTVMRFFQKLSARLVHFYGPTEAAINVTTASCRADWQTVTIGRPIANTAVYVLDPHLNPVPAGVRGELFIAGVALSRGYEGHAALTAKSFIPNPFGGEHPFAAAGSRLYRSGDLASLASNGTIYFHGREDRQVKIYGWRIEPREIESLLNNIEGITDSVVVCHAVNEGVKRLVAYLEVEKGVDVQASDLRAQLAHYLPDSMIPAVFVSLEKLPYLPSGKINRNCLPSPEIDWFAQGSDYVAPRTREEHLLTTIWTEILGIERVGIYDNFFRLGGDSMLTVRMEAKAAEAGLNLSTRQLFEHPTIAQLVSSLGESEELVLPENPLLHEAFENLADVEGNTIALVEEQGASYTYAQLNYAANQMANRLLRLGISRGNKVGVCSPGVKGLIAYLAVLKCGAACLPMDPAWLLEQRQRCCLQAGLDAVLVDSSARIPEALIPIFLINANMAQETANPAVRLHGNDVAILSFREAYPKYSHLVAVDHNSLMRVLTSLKSVPGMEAHDIFVLLEPRGPQWMLWPLLSTARLVLPLEGTHLDPVATNRILHNYQASVALVGSKALPSFLTALRPGDASIKLLLEGEISVPEARTLLGRYRQIWHLYGWAETAYCCARGLMESRALEDAEGHVGVSAPLHGAWLYILDTKLYSTRPGTMGELFVGGTVLAQHYLNDARSTAAHFIPDPFTRVMGARLYRTGQRGFFLADGRIFFP